MCERTVRSRVTLRKGGQVELWGRTPKQLNAARCCLPGGWVSTEIFAGRFTRDKVSEAIHSLKPVTFRYKEELEPEGIP